MRRFGRLASNGLIEIFKEIGILGFCFVFFEFFAPHFASLLFLPFGQLVGIFVAPLFLWDLYSCILCFSIKGFVSY